MGESEGVIRVQVGRERANQLRRRERGDAVPFSGGGATHDSHAEIHQIAGIVHDDRHGRARVGDRFTDHHRHERSTRRPLVFEPQALDPPLKSLRAESTPARERLERSPDRAPLGPHLLRANQSVIRRSGS